MLAFHAETLWHRSHYEFSPLVPLAAVFLAVPACQRLGPLVPGSPRWVALLVGVSWSLLATTILCSPHGWGPWPRWRCWEPSRTGSGAARLLRALLPAWALLGLVIPPPFGLDLKLVTLLQTVTGRAGSLALDTLGVFHVMEGNVVCVPGREFMVEEACSGIHSLYVVLASTFFFVLWARRTLPSAVLLILAGFAWVMLANITRVVTVAYLGTRWGIDVGDGWRHQA